MVEIAESRKTVAAWVAGDRWFPLVEEVSRNGVTTRRTTFPRSNLYEGWQRVPASRVADAAACEAEAVRLFGPRPADFTPGKPCNFFREGAIARSLLAVKV